MSTDLHADVKLLRSYFEAYRTAGVEAVNVMADLIQKVKRNKRDQSYTRAQLVDLGFLFREIERLSDEVRKDSAAKVALTGKLVAHEALEAYAAGTLTSPTTHGLLASGVPTMREIAACPKVGTPEFKAACMVMGVPEEIARGELMAFRFTGLSDWLTKMAEDGKEVPKVFRSWTEFKTVFRRKSFKE